MSRVAASGRFSLHAERILSLVSGYRDPFRRWLVMLQACADDSGEQSGPVFLLGALLAPVSAWVKFTEEWHQELEERPKVRYFKLQEAIRSVEQFAGTSTMPELVRYKIDRLSRIVQRHVTRAISWAVHIDDFNSFLKPGLLKFEEDVLRSRFKTPALVEFAKNEGVSISPLGISRPYFLLAFLLIRRLDSFAGNEEMSVVFDDQSADGQRVQFWWPFVARGFNAQDVRHSLQRSPDYRSDEEFAPLQAANSFAWLQHREYATEPLTGITVQPPTLADLLGDVPREAHFCHPRELAPILETLLRRRDAS